MFNFVIFGFILLVMTIRGFYLPNNLTGDEIYSASLDSTGEIMMYWITNEAAKNIQFEIHIPQNNIDWFAFGFSDRGRIMSADFCVLSSGWNILNMMDTWTDVNSIIHLDEQQDCLEFRATNEEKFTKFTFSRKFDTCDTRDYIIEDGTTHIVWVRGKGPVGNVEGLNLTRIQEKDYGMIRVSLLKYSFLDELPEHVYKLDIIVDRVPIPRNETTYWCSVQKLPEALMRKHHIYQFESHIQKENKGIVHHMEVFHCFTEATEKIPLFQGSCFAPGRPLKTQVCKKVLAAWAMGASPFIYPEEASLAIGGPEFNMHIMLEIHYNNPSLLSGRVDSSGIRLYISDKLKAMDAGILELGLEYTDKMAIPPNQKRFYLQGFCVSECTAVSLSNSGIKVFGSQLHTHLTGVRVSTKHFRNGHELSPLNIDNHYSTHFQEIRRLKRIVQVFPGDMLLTRCDYNTVGRSNITLGGFGISDEMCVNYVHYFPVSKLEVCKSSISDDSLRKFFEYMNEWEGQNTSRLMGISENYKTINWNKMRIKLLEEVYNESPISMQCNMSSGERFPGYWGNILLPEIFLSSSTTHRPCA